MRFFKLWLGGLGALSDPQSRIGKVVFFGPHSLVGGSQGSEGFLLGGSLFSERTEDHISKSEMRPARTSLIGLI